MSPFIIPIFITHQGCPHRCIFCNQEKITGKSEQSCEKNPADLVEPEILKWLQRSNTSGKDVQVAFYGGSFTGLPLPMQTDLLRAVRPFIASGRVASIRLSTRPDYIDSETPHFLYNYGVRTVELGIQSLEPTVLEKSRRGHTVAHVERALQSLRQMPILIGGQLMVGLPGETVGGAIRGAHFLATLGPDFVRIYPTLVVCGSGLEGLYQQGAYQPLSLNKAVALSARLKTIFDTAKIPIVRMGLQPTSDLDVNVVAGPHHPAFGELVKSRLLFKKARAMLTRSKFEGTRQLHISKTDESIFRGQKSCTLKRLSRLGLLDGVDFVFDVGQERGELKVE